VRARTYRARSGARAIYTYDSLANRRCWPRRWLDNAMLKNIVEQNGDAPR